MVEKKSSSRSSKQSKETEHGPKKKTNKVVHFFSSVPHQIDRFFYWYGGKIGDYPIWFLCIPLLVSFVLAPGMLQLQREIDNDKLWPISGSMSINNLTAMRLFDSLKSPCICPDGMPNCRKPKLCSNGPDASEPVNNTEGGKSDLTLMFVSRNKSVSMTDAEMISELMELDMRLSFGFYVINNFKPVFFSSNVSEWQLCERNLDGSCKQYSIITGVRSAISKLPGLGNYSAQNKFLLDLQDDQEKQDFFRDLLKDQAKEPVYYPFDKEGKTFIGRIYGDVTMENASQTWQNGYKAAKVKHIGAMLMAYYLSGPEDDRMLWTREATRWLEERYTNNKSFTKFELMVRHSWSGGDRNGAEIARMVPYLVVCVLCLMIFCGLTTLRGFPAHRTLPWIGPLGVGCSMLGVASSFGLIGWMQMKIVDLCFAIPVLILAVGIDDIFVYTEAWRATKSNWILRRRLAKTMKIAAPGIVVTSFMNSLAFIIDTQSLINALQIFSNVSTVAAIFDFVYQMTLFPACLVLIGNVDKKNRHGCCCCIKMTTKTKKMMNNDSPCYLFCCTAPKKTLLKEEDMLVASSNDAKEDLASESEHEGEGEEAEQPKKSSRKKSGKHDKNKIQQKPVKKRHFFRDIYAPFLLKPKVSLLAMILYAGYVVTVAFLATKIHVGMRLEHMAPARKDGALNEMEYYIKYFRTFSFEVSVMFMDPVDYWNNQTQAVIEELYQELLTIPNIGPSFLGNNWYRDFLSYARQNKLDISTEESFVYNLREKYLSDPKVSTDILGDIKFVDPSDDDFIELEYQNPVNNVVIGLPPIAATRFTIWGVNVVTGESAGDVIRRMRYIKQKHADDHLPVTFFSGEFGGTEPMLATAYIVVYNTLVQLAAVLCVTATMMPHPVALFWIALMLSSITVGVISISCSWSIDFDQIAMINIMLTMGYCVDFSAHMTRTYVASKAKTRYKKVLAAVSEFGFPIIQSSVAAILAVLCLGASYSYILLSGFKFFFVGILLSIVHTLVFFPVFLLYLGPGPSKHKKVKAKPDEQEQKKTSSTEKSGSKNSGHRHSKSSSGGDGLDAKKMASSIMRQMSRQKRSQRQDSRERHDATLDRFNFDISSLAGGGKKASHPWSIAYTGSIASGPARRAYVPDLNNIPSLTEMVTINAAVPQLVMDQRGNLIITHEDETTSSTVYTSNSYEQPPQF